MKLAYFALSAAVLLAGCNQTPPATSVPTAAVAPVAPTAVDSAAAAPSVAPVVPAAADRKSVV